MLKPFLLCLLFLLFQQTSPAQETPTPVEKSTEQLIKENEELIRQNQPFEDSLEKIRTDINARNRIEMIKLYEKRQEDKKLHKAILYIIIGLSMFVVLVIGLRRKTRK